AFNQKSLYCSIFQIPYKIHPYFLNTTEIIKAEFDLKFANNLNPEKELYWKGLIYSKIEK
ncbi:MAG: hypothetical protein AAFQ92_29480, partial [Bacteroidota bacterium]